MAGFRESIVRTGLMAGSAAVAIVAVLAASSAARAQALPLPGQYNWGGFYVGVHGGGAWTDTNSSDFGDCGPFTNLVNEGGGPASFDSVDDLGCTANFLADGPNTGLTVPSFDLDGDYVAWTGEDEGGGDDFSGLVGGHVGYNWQSGRFVFGVEGDFSGVFDDGDSSGVSFDYFDDYALSSERRTPDSGGLPSGPDLAGYFGSGTVSRETELNWISTIRGRVGGVFGPTGRVLLYGTGGLAIASISESMSANFDTSRLGDAECDVCSFSGGHDDDNIHVGFTVGAGGEFGVTDHIRFGVEYLYTHFDDEGSDSVTFTGAGGRQFDVELDGGIEDIHTFRARLTYAFGQH